MRNKRRIQSEEINMTPLLDVLFSILFIVMLSGARVQTQNTAQNQDLSNQVENLQNEIAKYENKEQTKNQFYEDVCLITFDNVREEDKRILRINCEKWIDEPEKIITLNVNDGERLKRVITDYIDKIVNDNKSSPIYIVFECDENNIYKSEYDIINNLMESYEHNNSYKLFYKNLIGGNTNEEQ